MDNSSRTGTVPQLADAATLTDRLLAEGLAADLVAAAEQAGLRRGACPHVRTLLRAAFSGRLDALRIRGRWTTSSAAIRRWIAAAQQRRHLQDREHPEAQA